MPQANLHFIQQARFQSGLVIGTGLVTHKSRYNLPIPTRSHAFPALPTRPSPCINISDVSCEGRSLTGQVCPDLLVTWLLACQHNQLAVKPVFINDTSSLCLACQQSAQWLLLSPLCVLPLWPALPLRQLACQSAHLAEHWPSAYTPWPSPQHGPKHWPT